MTFTKMKKKSTQERPFSSKQNIRILQQHANNHIYYDPFKQQNMSSL